MDANQDNALSGDHADETNPAGARLNPKRSRSGNSSDHPIVPRSSSHMLVAALPQFNIIFENYLRLSTFVPSARALFQTIDLVYSRMSRLRGFRDTYQSTSILPKIRLYYGYVFYIHVMRIQIEFGLTNQDIVETYDSIVRVYPLESFKIAEPFVPFFAAICSFQPFDSRFGRVIPRLPNEPGGTANNYGALENGLMYILPNMTSLIHMVKRSLILNANNHVPDYFANINNTTGADDVAPAHNAAGLNRFKRTNVGPAPLSMTPYSDERTRDSVRAYTLTDDYVPPAFAGPNPVNLDTNTWRSYLKLNNSNHHIGRLIADSAFMDIPFSGNSTLAQIATSGPAYASVVFHLDNEGIAFADETVASAAATVLPLSGNGNVYEPPDSMSIALRASSGIPLDAVKIACITQINIKLPTNYAADSENIGSSGNTWTGPYWEEANLRRYAFTPTVNPTPLVITIIEDALRVVRLDRLPTTH